MGSTPVISPYNALSFSKTNLYIKGLSKNVKDNDLFNMCSKFGKIISTKAIIDKETNTCKGFGFVDFEDADAAQKALLELSASGNQVQMAKLQTLDSTNIYIANLPPNFQENDLENIISPLGRILSLRILKDGNGSQFNRTKGVGFARMESKSCCDKVIAHLNGKILDGSTRPLVCKFADNTPEVAPNTQRISGYHFPYPQQLPFNKPPGWYGSFQAGASANYFSSPTTLPYYYNYNQHHFLQQHQQLPNPHHFLPRLLSLQQQPNKFSHDPSSYNGSTTAMIMTMPPSSPSPYYPPKSSNHVCVLAAAPNPNRFGGPTPHYHPHSPGTRGFYYYHQHHHPSQPLHKGDGGFNNAVPFNGGPFEPPSPVGAAPAPAGNPIFPYYPAVAAGQNISFIARDQQGNSYLYYPLMPTHMSSSAASHTNNPGGPTLMSPPYVIQQPCVPTAPPYYHLPMQFHQQQPPFITTETSVISPQPSGGVGNTYLPNHLIKAISINGGGESVENLPYTKTNTLTSSALPLMYYYPPLPSSAASQSLIQSNSQFSQYPLQSNGSEYDNNQSLEPSSLLDLNNSAMNDQYPNSQIGFIPSGTKQPRDTFKLNCFTHPNQINHTATKTSFSQQKESEMLAKFKDLSITIAHTCISNNYNNNSDQTDESTLSTTYTFASTTIAQSSVIVSGHDKITTLNRDFTNVTTSNSSSKVQSSFQIVSESNTIAPTITTEKSEKDKLFIQNKTAAHSSSKPNINQNIKHGVKKDKNFTTHQKKKS